MTFIQYLIIFLLLYLCLYALINRLCQCIEHCATAKAYGKFREAGVTVKIDDLEEVMKKTGKKKDNVECL